jgi:hypothetical protein
MTFFQQLTESLDLIVVFLPGAFLISTGVEMCFNRLVKYLDFKKDKMDREIFIKQIRKPSFLIPIINDQDSFIATTEA